MWRCRCERRLRPRRRSRRRRRCSSCACAGTAGCRDLRRRPALRAPAPTRAGRQVSRSRAATKAARVWAPEKGRPACWSCHWMCASWRRDGAGPPGAEAPGRQQACAWWRGWVRWVVGGASRRARRSCSEGAQARLLGRAVPARVGSLRSPTPHSKATQSTVTQVNTKRGAARHAAQPSMASASASGPARGGRVGRPVPGGAPSPEPVTLGLTPRPGPWTWWASMWHQTSGVCEGWGARGRGIERSRCAPRPPHQTLSP